jgi:cytochrome d ubiquinol oxidase subunit II
VVVALAVLHPNISERYLDDIWPAILPTLALVALGAAWVFVRRGEPFRAFLASSATIGLLLISGGVGLYPNLIISTTDTAYNLTIFNAASADNTLVDADRGGDRYPVRAAYTTGVYIFRGKTVVDSTVDGPPGAGRPADRRLRRSATPEAGAARRRGSAAPGLRGGVRAGPPCWSSSRPT